MPKLLPERGAFYCVLFGLAFLLVAVDAVDFSGSYSDPNHSNCLRTVQVVGTRADVSGTDGSPGCPPDGTGEAWDLVGEVHGETIQVDFSPKGGPANLTGKYETSPSPGIRWPDGNLWSKKNAMEDVE